MPNTPAQRGADDITVGEVNRNVVDLRSILQDFITEVRTGFVRKDLYDAESKTLSAYVDRLQVKAEKIEDDLEALAADVAKREKERIDRAAADRRLILTAILAPIAVAIIVYILLGQT
jgi:hypothetical protein